jgi:hypothetical protein
MKDAESCCPRDETVASCAVTLINALRRYANKRHAQESIAPPKKSVQFFVTIGVPPAMHKIAAMMPAIWIVALPGN